MPAQYEQHGERFVGRIADKAKRERKAGIGMQSDEGRELPVGGDLVFDYFTIDLPAALIEPVITGQVRFPA